MPKKKGRSKSISTWGNLNIDYPKDKFPLPITNAITDNTYMLEWTFIVDRFFRHNQIKIYSKNKKHTFFIIPGEYCYTIMLINLKNVGDIYQRAMSTILYEHLCNIVMLQDWSRWSKMIMFKTLRWHSRSCKNRSWR